MSDDAEAVIEGGGVVSGCCQRIDFGDDIVEELNCSTDSDPGLVPQTPLPKPFKQIGKVTPIRRSLSTPVRDIGSSFNVVDGVSKAIGVSASGIEACSALASPIEASVPVVSQSPPYQAIRTLRLMGSPQTPKTLFERSQSSGRAEPRVRVRLFDQPPPPRSLPSTLIETRPVARVSTTTSGVVSRRRTQPLFVERKQVNVNPFTPRGFFDRHRKRSRETILSPKGNTPLNDEDLWEDELEHEAKIQRMYLSPNDDTYSRYEQEFLELCQIGNGEFGAVFKCIHRLDGCVYAIKRLKKPMEGSAEEKESLTEVWAHAVLGVDQHVVRYYSAWAERNHMIIQNEFCDGGSLQDLMLENQKRNVVISEVELCRLGLHVAQGLKFIHSQNLVHMDIKPGNIFISRQEGLDSQMVAATEKTPSEDTTCSLNEKLPVAQEASSADKENENHCRQSLTSSSNVIYKIGDLGRVTSALAPEVQEGDCRYMAPELLCDDYRQLPKADIFSLGLTLYELGLNRALPKNGDVWQLLRRGGLEPLPQCSAAFNGLLARMCHPDPSERPTALQLTADPCLAPEDSKSTAQLRKELDAEKFRSKVLEEQLRRAALCLRNCAGFQPKIDFLAESSSFLQEKGSSFLTSKLSETIQLRNFAASFTSNDSNNNNDCGENKGDQGDNADNTAISTTANGECRNISVGRSQGANSSKQNGRNYPFARRNLFVGCETAGSDNAF